MDEQVEKAIEEMLDRPGWTTARAVLKRPLGEIPKEDVAKVEEVMRKMAEKGVVALWRLTTEQHGEFLVVARPDFELDKELVERQAWAKAERIDVE
jgi:uncharacterized protein YqgQ